MKSIKSRFKRAPISHAAGAILLLGGAAVVGVFVYHLIHHHKMLSVMEFAAYGPGQMILGGILWSRWGDVVDIALGFAEKKAGEAGE